MTVNAIGVSYTDLQLENAYEAGWNPTVSTWSAARTALFKRVLKKSQLQYYNPPILPGERTRHEWSFLNIFDSIEFVTSYSTGTISSSLEVVTLTGGTWPSWAAQGKLWVDDKQLEVASRTSDTVIVLQTALDIDFTAETYQLRGYYYDLPDDFGGIDSAEFTVSTTRSLEPIRLTRVSDRAMREQQNVNISGTPYRYALTPRIPTITDSGHWAVSFGPDLADTATLVDYRYKAIPPLLDGTAHIYPYGGDEHGQTIIASLVDVVHQQIHNSFEKHAPFLEQLAASVMQDRQNSAPHNLGVSRSGYEDYPYDIDDVLYDWHSHTHPTVTLPS